MYDRSDARALHEIMQGALRQHEAFARGELAIVAVSGGCDSVALLHLLLRSRTALGIDLHVASLDHGLRGAAGRGDLDFVAELAAGWGLPFTIGETDVPQRARDWGIGIEEAARRARYAFLATVASERGGRAIAVGHHALDQAETIMMNIARGCGLRGLRGMQVLSALPGHPRLRLVRPLLGVSKADLEAYCRARELPYRVDQSNADIAYRRNFIRHEVMDRLQRLNPDALAAFARLSESATVDEEFIASAFERTVMPMVEASPARWRISRDDFAALRPALRRRFIQAAFRQLSGQAGAPSHALTLDLDRWLLAAASRGARDMSADIRMRLEAGAICVESKARAFDDARCCLIPAGADEPIIAGATLVLGDLKASLLADRKLAHGDLRLMLGANSEPRLRTRRPGDRFKPKGMGGRSRKLKAWMIDRKVPRPLRDRIPLICADGEIVAIALGDAWHLADGVCRDPGVSRSDILTVWRGGCQAK